MFEWLKPKNEVFVTIDQGACGDEIHIKISKEPPGYIATNSFWHDVNKSDLKLDISSKFKIIRSNSNVK